MLGPSLAYHQSAQAAGDFAFSFDALNMHPYPGGGPPEPALADNLRSYRAWAPGVSDVVVTETGYHNALGDGTAAGGYIGQPGVPEAVEARYLPRLFLEGLHQGVSRTFVYELLDLFPNPDDNHQEFQFGLLRNDLTEKPGYRALQNLVALFADPGPAFEPGALAVAVEGGPADLRSMLFQTRGGTFLLALWRPERSYEIPAGWRSGEAGQVLDVAPAAVTVRLAAAVAGAEVFVPSRSAEPVETVGRTDAVPVSVADELVVVALTPGGPTDTPTAPGAEPLLTSAGPSPNPTASGAAVPFALAAPAEVTLDVFDVLGRRVWSGRARAASAGRFVVPSEGWPPGTYLTRLTARAAGQSEAVAGRLTVR